MKKLFEVYILLGTNLGNREKHLRSASNAILDKFGWLVKRSKIFETSPWGMKSESKFLNQVLFINTELSPRELLEACLDIEKNMGRRRSDNYLDRPIDIDLIFYDDEIINEENLIIPHPRMHLRKFTLIPMVELNPKKRHPVFNKSMQELLDICEDGLEVKEYSYID